MIEAGVHIIDFGAESTRPGATPLTADAEWSRLAPVLTGAIARLGGDPLRPALSVDTYHVTVAERALALGVDMINDVGGLTDPGMLALAAESGARFVAMHNLGLPADPGLTLATDRSATDQVEAWLDERLGQWQAAGIDLGRIVFDPGIGFGKNPLQSLDLLRNIGRLNGKGLRLLVGHSRKSFLRGFAADAPAERALVTLGSSMALCARGVDILRVHNVADHALAYRGWAHLQPAD
jgi:dihydropteroate synthase